MGQPSSQFDGVMSRLAQINAKAIAVMWEHRLFQADNLSKLWDYLEAEELFDTLQGPYGRSML